MLFVGVAACTAAEQSGSLPPGSEIFLPSMWFSGPLYGVYGWRECPISGANSEVKVEGAFRPELLTSAGEGGSQLED
jgi:hypothetical protein